MENGQRLEASPDSAQLRELLMGRELSVEQLETVIAALIPTDIQEKHYYCSDSGAIELDPVCEHYEIYMPIDWDYKVQEAFLCLAYSYGPYGHKVANEVRQQVGVCTDAEKMLFLFNVAKAMALVVVLQKTNDDIRYCEEYAENTSELTQCRDAVQLQRILMQQKIMTSPFPEGDELIETMASLYTIRKQLREEGVPLETW